jgi:hypothetical protein
MLGLTAVEGMLHAAVVRWQLVVRCWGPIVTAASASCYAMLGYALHALCVGVDVVAAGDVCTGGGVVGPPLHPHRLKCCAGCGVLVDQA